MTKTPLMLFMSKLPISFTIDWFAVHHFSWATYSISVANMVSKNVSLNITARYNLLK